MAVRAWANRGEAIMIDEFVFEAAKRAFDKSIVVAGPFRLVEAVRPCWLEQLPVTGAGELGSARSEWTITFLQQRGLKMS